ncbi:NADP-dependent oxidoreductase [Coralloluteibacterium stylophorae]|uniref:NADP-dependent oxidoreductase n=1 Tax=Coralloluteibacterium stylophorae TaxID=1776034 RepID=A0A8J8AW24_9GAMM|nr:NADP-dependent oxidoreductase [Coralloluteibacterium stylophorae]MBS7458089.1 NADP-dependent oxidoreductase [Coralloluteibacterium stylophorae]
MSTTKAIRIHRFGGPEVLQFEDVTLPELAADELLVRVHAASVNPVDYKIRGGGYLPEDRLPVTLGRDLSGVVEARGDGLHSLAQGDAVYAMVGMDRGAYAQHVVVKTSECARKPASLDHDAAAAVPLAALTAWRGLFDHGGLKKGERVLIHGGSGGVGHLAIQFATACGAHVITTVSADDIDFVRDLGAHEPIDYRAHRFEDEVGDVDLVFDLVAGETQDRSWQVLRREGGRLVSTLSEPDAGQARRHNARTAHYMAHPDADQLAGIARMIDDGRVRVVVERTYVLDEAADAQRHLENDHVRGKLVLRAA